MSGISIGDMAQQFSSLRNGGAIKARLSSLSQSLSSGKIDDLTAALSGGTERFSGLSYSLEQLAAYQSVAQTVSQQLNDMQRVLSQVDGLRTTAADRLLRVNDASTAAQVDEAAQSSGRIFEEMVRAMNTQVGDRALFGGARVDAAPLQAPADLLAAITVSIGAATDASAIVAAVDGWFDDLGGGFETLGYSGGTGPAVEKRISETGAVAMAARADDPAIRETLKGAALAALANMLPGLDLENKTALLKAGGQRLFAASSELIALQAQIGFSEQLVAEEMTRNKAQEAALTIARNNLSQADPFETATDLQAVQLQLETHFAVTARMSQLSLLRYI